jgi:hypothetical protein
MPTTWPQPHILRETYQTNQLICDASHFNDYQSMFVVFNTVQYTTHTVQIPPVCRHGTHYVAFEDNRKTGSRGHGGNHVCIFLTAIHVHCILLLKITKEHAPIVTLTPCYNMLPFEPHSCITPLNSLAKYILID